MKKTIRLLLMAVMLLGINASVLAQENIVTGKVTGADDKLGLPGATVTVKGLSRVTTCDLDGNYRISASQEDVLVFSFMGYASQEVPVGTRSIINVELYPDQTMLEETVVVGYGIQKKVNLTGAVASVDVGKALDSRPITDITRGLQGAVAGLTVTSANGAIGADPKIKIRGTIGSLNGDANPLILLDNVEIPSLSLVNPDDIESISILKDAASTSIYGVRGAFGVILLTSKSAKKGQERVVVNYSNNFAFSNPTTTPDLASAAEGATLSYLGNVRRSPSSTTFSAVGYYYNLETIEKMKQWRQTYGGQKLGDEMVLGRDFEIDGVRTYFYREWDVEDMFMKNWAPQQQHNASVTGSSGNTTYGLSFGYLDQKGVFKLRPDNYNRYNGAMNLSTAINKWVTVRGKVLFSRTMLETPNTPQATSTANDWYYLYRWPSFYPYGKYNGQRWRGTIAEMEQAPMGETATNYLRLTAGLTANIIEGLTFDVDYTYSNTSYNQYLPGGEIWGIDLWTSGHSMDAVRYSSDTYSRVVTENRNTNTNSLNAFFTYTKSLGNHSFVGMTGMNLEEYKHRTVRGERRGLFDPNKAEFEMATGDQYASGTIKDWAVLGYFARINYSFKDRYLLELNGRLDGSSRFPTDDQWGFFPSASAGWRVTEEPFAEFVKPYLSSLKFRASYGQVGNQDVGEYQFLPVMTGGDGMWIVDGKKVYQMSYPRLVSSSLTWEKVTTLDIGVDARFLRDKIGVSFDWFQRITSDMLGTGATLPRSFGASPTQTTFGSAIYEIQASKKNFGELTNKGWEISVDFRHRFKNGINLYAVATLYDDKTKVTKFSGNPTKLLNNTNYDGRTLGEIWGYETDRLFQFSDFVEDPNGKVVVNGKSYVLATGIPNQEFLELASANFWFGPGDVKFVDRNNDGKIDQGKNTVDDPGDKKVIGNSLPRYQYSFRIGGDWKGFDIDIFFQGVGKQDLWVTGGIGIPNYRESVYAHQLNYWTPENTGAFYPRPMYLSENTDKMNFVPQSGYLADMSYLRCKNITVGYTLPHSILSKVGIQKLRVYFSGENLFEFDNLDIPIDPEIAQVTGDSNYIGRTYPYRRTLSFGVQLTF